MTTESEIRGRIATLDLEIDILHARLGKACLERRNWFDLLAEMTLRDGLHREIAEVDATHWE